MNNALNILALFVAVTCGAFGLLYLMRRGSAMADTGTKPPLWPAPALCGLGALAIIGPLAAKLWL